MNTQPNKENSRFKLWIRLKNGTIINMLSFPKEDKQFRHKPAPVFARMFKRILIERYSGQYQYAVFYDIKANVPIYKVDSFGNIKRAENN